MKSQWWAIALAVGASSSAYGQSLWEKTRIVCERPEQARRVVELSGGVLDHVHMKGENVGIGKAYGCLHGVVEHSSPGIERDRFVRSGRIFKIVEVVVTEIEADGKMITVPSLVRYIITYERIFAS